jgi:hypothetical protein
MAKKSEAVVTLKKYTIWVELMRPRTKLKKCSWIDR